MFKRIVALGCGVLLLTAAGALAQESVTPAGDGTAENPYQITQVGHLVWMEAHVAESAGKHYRLMNDIDASACGGYWCYAPDNPAASGILQGGFEPIGDETDSFEGIFDGGGHVIRGLRVGERSHAGLFGAIGAGGAVCNLGLTGAYMNGSTAGGIAAVIRGGTISNCWVSAILIGYSSVGGVAGEVDQGTVCRCYATGTCREGNGSYGTSGGIAGLCLSGSTVTECYAAVAVKGATQGGLIAWGADELVVTNSYWDVETSGTTNSWLGGEGKTSREMRHSDTFDGWDFTNVWDIAEGSSTPYLRLCPPVFALTVVTQGMGRVEIAPQKAVYQPGERVTLTAFSDAPGYVLAHWAGGESNLLTAVTTVAMTGPRTLLAAFKPATDIATVEELQAMGGANNYRLTRDIDATATTNWDGGAGFAPIAGPFTGIFDGNGHVIRGLTINRPGQDGVGLIGDVEYPGLVRRVGLDGGSVTGGNLVGSLAGVMCASVIEECHAACDVLGAGNVGGLLGRSTGCSGPEGAINRCYAKGKVVATNSDPLGAWCAGGLIGALDHASVEECFALGNVSCVNSAGGLVGESACSFGGVNRITKCFASGGVEGRIGVGGLIGHDAGASLVRSCFASGRVKGENEVGGLIGSGGTYSVGQPDGAWVTSLGESYAVGRLVRFQGDDGTLAGGCDYDWSPAAYWDEETTWTPPSAFNFGKSTAQMKQPATFTGWDFTNIWGIAEGVSYPYLRGAGAPFMLHVVAEGPGRVTVSPQKATYAPGEVVTLTAVPDTVTNLLARWVGLVADEDAAVTTVTMDTHKTVTAVFVTPKAIASIEELQKIGYDPAYPSAGAYRLTQDIDARDTANWNAGAGFLPLAQGYGPGFEGLLDGQGHTITGLTINRPGESFVGLIGSHGFGGVLRNVGLCACSVIGGSRVGGLVGHNYYGRVARSFVQGSVGGEGPHGGVVGCNEGALSKCYASGMVVATNTAGGLVGEQYHSGRIYESYAASAVSGGAAAGGLVGLVDSDAYGVVTQSYWDVEASGCAVSAGGEGRTTAEMLQPSTYAGWDFSIEWGIDEGAGYPFLWQFRLGLPSGLGAASGTNRPAYAAWAAAHTNAWGTADFSGVPARDFETAWLLDQRPEAGFAEASGLSVAGFEVGASEIRVTLALTAAGAAKEGRVNAWLAVQGKAALSDEWVVVAAQQAGEDRLAFADGAATVTLVRPDGYAFFRPILLPSRPASDTPVHQVVP